MLMLCQYLVELRFPQNGQNSFPPFRNCSASGMQKPRPCTMLRPGSVTYETGYQYAIITHRTRISTVLIA